MGTVYLAFDDRRAGAHRIVALKRIHPHLTHDREFVDMFLDEAEVGSRIDHPNVARVLDYGQLDDSPFLVMEYLAGESLARVFDALIERRCPWSSERRAALVAKIIADASEGLHAAHELSDDDGRPLGVVHRDVSPQNVFITYDGIVKVLDFGTVRALGQRHRTRTGFIKGKCAYIAPEIILSQPFDRRADVWSLGVLLWELLTQQRLFTGNSAGATVRAVLETRVPPPSEVDPSLPASYDDVVMAALQPDPRQRLVSARELGRALMGILLETRQAVDAPALADWMTALFIGGRQQHRRTIERAAPSVAEPADDHLETMLYCTVDEEVEPSDEHDIVCSIETRVEPAPTPFPRFTGLSQQRLALAGVALAVVALALVLRAELFAASQPPPVAAPEPSALLPAASAAPTTEAHLKRDGRLLILEVWSTDQRGERELIWYGPIEDPSPPAAPQRPVVSVQKPAGI